MRGLPKGRTKTHEHESDRTNETGDETRRDEKDSKNAGAQTAPASNEERDRKTDGAGPRQPSAQKTENTSQTQAQARDVHTYTLGEGTAGQKHMPPPTLKAK